MIFINKRPSLLSVVTNTLIRKIYTFLDRMRWRSYYVSVNYKFKKFGDAVVIDYGVQFGAPENISIGSNVFIGKNVLINAGKGGSIIIEDNAAIGANSSIITWNLDNLNNRTLIRSQNKNSFKDVVIGKGVGIGYNCTINAGVVLGDGCEIGAGSVVTRNVPPFAIMAGSPAVMVGIRRALD
ncbi:acyltransferase [Planktomarina sp.]|nr:acyltransferase [Planktomarina sp.]